MAASPRVLRRVCALGSGALGALVLVTATPATASLLPPKPNPSTPSTTAPPATSPSTTAPRPVPTTSPKPGPSEAGTRTQPSAGPRSAARTTDALVAALAPLVASGLTATDAAVLGFGQFPVAGRARFADTWLAPRYTPVLHTHKGTDIFAARGTPVRAPIDGIVEHATGGAGGLAAYVHGNGGFETYLAHLSGFSGVRSGQRVHAGEVIGYVGCTGNAAGGADHVHFEVHDRGTQVNPKPYLDRWLDAAVAAAPGLVAARLAAQVHLAHAPAMAMTDEDVVVALLRPLTPAPLRPVLGLD